MVMQEIKDWVQKWVAGWTKQKFYERSEYKQTSSGLSSSGLPIRLDRNGKIDISFLETEDNAEYIADTVGAMVTGNTETGIAVTYQDADNTLDFVVDTEFIADTVGAMVSGNTETGIAVTYQDADNTIDFAVDTEYIADTVGAMVSGNTETGITVTYQDADNTIDFVVDDEYITDLIGAMVSGNTETGITVTYQDADNTLDFDAQTAGDVRYAPIAKGVTNGDSHDHAGGDGAQIDHGGLAGLGDNDHPQYALLTASQTFNGTNQFVGSGAPSVEVRRFQSGASTSLYEVLKVLMQTSGSSTNGFANTIAFYIIDSSATEGLLGQIGFHRNGADDTGRFVVRCSSGGTPSENLSLDASGTLVVSGINVGEDTLTVYDEGTWTPDVTASASNPTVSYSNRSGTYVRVNNLVHFQARTLISTISGGSGTLRFSLPLTSFATRPQVGSVYITVGGSPIVAALAIDSSASYASVYSTVPFIAGGGFTNGDIIIYGGCYYVA